MVKIYIHFEGFVSNLFPPTHIINEQLTPNYALRILDSVRNMCNEDEAKVLLVASTPVVVNFFRVSNCTGAPKWRTLRYSDKLLRNG